MYRENQTEKESESLKTAWLSSKITIAVLLAWILVVVEVIQCFPFLLLVTSLVFVSIVFACVVVCRHSLQVSDI